MRSATDAEAWRGLNYIKSHLTSAAWELFKAKMQAAYKQQASRQGIPIEETIMSGPDMLRMAQEAREEAK